MNNSVLADAFYDTFMKNFISVALGLIINYINGTFVMVFFTNTIFSSDPRYILYIHLVINDMIMLSVSVALQVTTYVLRFFSVSVCCALLFILSTVTKNSPLNLACMAIERYIAICHPLHHPQMCTARRTYVLIWFIWTASAVPSLCDIFILLSLQPPGFFSTSLLCSMLQIYSSWQHTVRETVVNVVYLSFVWITLIFTYFKVFSAANAACADQVSAGKARKTILLHGVQLLLCMMSYITPSISRTVIDLFPQSRTIIMFLVFLLANVIPRLLSPLIYGLRDKQLVELIKVYFCCKPERAKITPVK